MAPRRTGNKSATAVKFKDERENTQFKTNLIEFVKANTLLWDPNDVNYLNNAAKKSVWAAFCKGFYSNLSVESVKKSWKSLRDSFKREHCLLSKQGKCVLGFKHIFIQFVFFHQD